MASDSPLFDRIRVKPSEDRSRKPDAPCCDWKDCNNEATHRAPKGRNRENQYWRFCLDHVRAYNQSYNYFTGMTDDAVLRYQKDAITGHRPTWKMGTGTRPAPEFGPHGPQDPFNMFRDFGGSSGSGGCDWPSTCAAASTTTTPKEPTA